MCTISWLHTRGGYEVFFNRDEQHSRPEALPPTIQQAGGVNYIAPIDPQSGGTWIAVNEYGVCFCLLNTYVPMEFPPESPRSRGEIIPGCIGANTVFDGFHNMRPVLHMDDYEPFALFGHEPGGTGLALLEGIGLTTHPDASDWNPYSSSSVRSEEVVANRRMLFDLHVGRKVRDASQLADYHGLVDYEDPAMGVLMDREDARTVSVTRVRVGRRSVQMSYRARARDGTFAPPVRVEMERKVVPRA